MKIINLAELSGVDDLSITSIFGSEQPWREGQSFVMKNPRKQSALLWFCGANGAFLPEREEKIDVTRGALVYVPQGARYEVCFRERFDTVSTILIEFCLDDGEPCILFDKIKVIYDDLEDGRIPEVMRKIAYECKKPNKNNLKLHRNIFELLSLLAEKEERKSIRHKGFKTIEKGIEYLQNDANQELSIEEIAKMCFVTPAYFRRLFRDYSGMSPAEYRVHRRIERAKELMERTDISVRAVSDELAFSDPSYFCRVFKKEMGMSPSEYKKRIEKER